MLEGHIKYLVQVQCQPSPIGCEEQIVQSLNQSFNVKKCRCSSTGLTLELRSNHPLAYGTFKDLADLLVETLSEIGLRLRSGAINRVEPNSLGVLVGAFNKGIVGRLVGTREGVLSFLTHGPLPRIVGGIVGGTRLVPVMYFHRDVILDLFLATKVRHMGIKAVPEPN